VKYFLLFIALFSFSCAKQKSILICGDHKCVNKDEANQYFKENLTIEIQIVTKNEKSSFDLVDINTGDQTPNIKIFKKKDKKILKKLSKDEIKAKKAELKIKKKKSEPIMRVVKKNDNVLNQKKKLENGKKSYSKLKNVKQNNDIINKKSLETISSQNINNSSIDICLTLEKCDIDSIANYLIKISNKKDFPNISLRE